MSWKAAFDRVFSPLSYDKKSDLTHSEVAKITVTSVATTSFFQVLVNGALMTLKRNQGFPGLVNYIYTGQVDVSGRQWTTKSYREAMAMRVTYIPLLTYLNLQKEALPGWVRHQTQEPSNPRVVMEE